MVEIKGIEKFAPKDFEGYISATVFLGGCNLRCPYCQNSRLVLEPEKMPSFPQDYFLSFLDQRKGWLEGICVSGGEPLLDDELEVLLILIKERGLLAKIETNGCFPSRLETLIGKNLIDQVAMDVKAPLEKYGEVTRSKISGSLIQESIWLIKNSGLKYEFRTTVVPGLIDAQDVEKIGMLIEGADLYQIQQFFPLNTLDRNFLRICPYSREELEGFRKIVEPYVKEVRIEGI